MYSAIIPYALDLTAFVLVILCLLAGQAPKLMPNFSILSLNATGFRANYTAKAGNNAILPIHDVYSVYMSTHCEGYYINKTSTIGNVTCSRPSSYCTFLSAGSYEDFQCSYDPFRAAKFLIDEIINKELNITGTKKKPKCVGNKCNNADGSIEGEPKPAGVMLAVQLDSSSGILNSTDIHFPEKIQREFQSKFNLQLHIAYIFYILGLINVGGALAVGIAAFMKGTRGFILTLLTTPATLFIGIASLIVTIVQGSATKRLNACGNNSGVIIYHGHGYLAMTWMAVVLVALSTPAWWGAAIVSWDYRKNRKGKRGKGDKEVPDPETAIAHE